MKGRPPCAWQGSLPLLTLCCSPLGPVSLFCKPRPISGLVHLPSCLPEMPPPLTFPFSFFSLETQPSVSSLERSSWVPSRAVLITGSCADGTRPQFPPSDISSCSYSHFHTDSLLHLQYQCAGLGPQLHARSQDRFRSRTDTQDGPCLHTKSLLRTLCQAWAEFPGLYTQVGKNGSVILNLISTLAPILVNSV